MTELTRLTSFIGKQLSRFRLAQTYYSIITSTLSTVSLIALAFNISLYLLIIFFPIILLGILIIGYFMDVYNVNTIDMIKTNEIQHRYLNTRDMKIQEFQILQLKILSKIIKNNKDGFNIDFDEISKKYYKEYYDKWSVKK